MRPRLLFFLSLLLIAAADASAQPQQMPTVATVPAAAQASPNFDVKAATDAWMAEIPAAARARSDAYFEGTYWLTLWDYLYGAVVSVLFLSLGWSARMRDLAERITRLRWLRTFLYLVEYIVLSTILVFPLTVYEGYVREHQYGLATQTFGPWMGDQLKSLLIGIVMGGVFGAVLFAIVRRLPRTWWIWGAVVTLLFSIFAVVIAPVVLIPIFNDVKKLNDPKITVPILRLARANGIATNDVYEVDASRQTTRMSANVSGLGSTMRITLNDNLLKRGTREEILAVMGHEMGHYVLNHIYKEVIFDVIVIFVLFAGLNGSLQAALARWGEKWRIRDIGDPAVVPLVVLLGSTFMFLFTPLGNTWTRTQEYEADMYGLNASREPDGFAQAAIHLGEYRKMKPGPVEEWIFFDHPSGYNRIYAAMRWKAENLNTPGTE